MQYVCMPAAVYESKFEHNSLDRTREEERGGNWEIKEDEDEVQQKNKKNELIK